MIPFLPINFDIFSMDAIIYGGFFGLSLGAVAFNYMAKNTGLCTTLFINVTYVSFCKLAFHSREFLGNFPVCKHQFTISRKKNPSDYFALEHIAISS